MQLFLLCDFSYCSVLAYWVGWLLCGCLCGCIALINSVVVVRCLFIRYGLISWVLGVDVYGVWLLLVVCLVGVAFVCLV